MKLLNIYGQQSYHTEARIIGNTQGLLELRNLIDKAIENKVAVSDTTEDCIFPSDGEGYELTIVCSDDKWGIESTPDSFWNLEENYPEYINPL